MSISIGINSGLAGMRSGLDSMQEAASQIASKETFEGTGTKSLAEAMIDLKVSTHQVSASAQVVKAMDDVIGTLLDVKA